MDAIQRAMRDIQNEAVKEVVLAHPVCLSVVAAKCRLHLIRGRKSTTVGASGEDDCDGGNGADGVQRKLADGSHGNNGGKGRIGGNVEKGGKGGKGGNGEKGGKGGEEGQGLKGDQGWREGRARAGSDGLSYLFGLHTVDWSLQVPVNPHPNTNNHDTHDTHDTDDDETAQWDYGVILMSLPLDDEASWRDVALRVLRGTSMGDGWRFIKGYSMVTFHSDRSVRMRDHSAADEGDEGDGGSASEAAAVAVKLQVS